MGKTRRHEPGNGEFKKLKGSKKQRNKKQRATKANLQKEIRFVSVAQRFWDDLLKEEQHCCDHTKEYCEQNRGGDNCNLTGD